MTMLPPEFEPPKKPLRQFDSEEELPEEIHRSSDEEEATKVVMERLGIESPFPTEEEVRQRRVEYDYLVANGKVIQAFIPAAKALYEVRPYKIYLFKPDKYIVKNKFPMQVSLIWNYEQKLLSDWRYKLLRLPPHQKISWNEVEAHVLYAREEIEGISVNGSSPGVPHDSIEDLTTLINDAILNPMRKSYIEGDPEAISNPLMGFPIQQQIHFQFRSADHEQGNNS